MNQILIKQSETHYIVVDDSPVREGDWCAYNKMHDSKNPQWEIVQCGKVEREEMHPISEGRLLLWMKKITHSTQPLDKDIQGFGYWTKDIIPLSLKEVKVLIYAYNWKAEFEKSNLKYGAEQHSFFLGFNAHKELVKDKVFTIEDMNNLLQVCIEASMTGTSVFVKRTGNEYIKSLLPPTQWPVTFDDQGKLKMV
jgi:hypothetical protein